MLLPSRKPFETSSCRWHSCLCSRSFQSLFRLRLVSQLRALSFLGFHVSCFPSRISAALKIEHGGNYRATLTTRLLSHYRAAGGAICVVAAGYMLFQNVRALVIGASTAPIELQLFWVVLGVLMVVVGFLLIVRAFARESNGVQRSNT